MTSGLKETKFYFETLFAENWSTTPIHFVGQDFNQDDTPRWINPFYTPSYSQAKGLGDLTSNYGVVRIACWAENDVEAMGLADVMITFMSENTSNAYRVAKYTIDDHGWHKSDKVFVIVSFNVEILEGIC